VILRRELAEREWEAEDLAERSGIDHETVLAILDGSQRITRDLASLLGAALGTSGALWYEMERSYRRWLRDHPNEAGRWLSSEVLDALNDIEGYHVAKKRSTVLLLAWATASDVPWSTVFDDPRCCNQRIWYQKWQYDEAIAEALDICTERALAWRDRETARIERAAAAKRHRSIAEGSVDAVAGLRATALSNDDRADYRTEASRILLALADPDLAVRLGQVTPAGGLEMHGTLGINGLGSLGEAELDALIRNLTAAAGVAGGESPDEG
jgi:plasmid maintenance system antidote protein VapI